MTDEDAFVLAPRAFAYYFPAPEVIPNAELASQVHAMPAGRVALLISGYDALLETASGNHSRSRAVKFDKTVPRRLPPKLLPVA
jgi:hypothetical protein